MVPVAGVDLVGLAVPVAGVGLASLAVLVAGVGLAGLAIPVAGVGLAVPVIGLGLAGLACLAVPAIRLPMDEPACPRMSPTDWSFAQGCCALVVVPYSQAVKCGQHLAAREGQR